MASRHKASSEWIEQRVTAVLIAIIGLAAFILLIVKGTLYGGFISNAVNGVMEIISGEAGLKIILQKMFSGVYSTAIGIIFSWAIFYHGAIGMKIIYEDYIHTLYLRKIITALTFFTAYFVIIICIITILNAHLSSLVAV